MRLRSALVVAGFAAATCASPPDVIYRCESDGSCAEGKHCCADGFCHDACGANGGGTSQGGGLASGGGETSGGGAASAGGGTASAGGGAASTGGGTASAGGGAASAGGGAASTGGGTVSTGGGTAGTGGGTASTGGGTGNGGGGGTATGGGAACTPGELCTGNPSPCKVGGLKCLAMTCADTTVVRSSGTPCLTNGTCDDAGTCIVCGANTMPCPGGYCWNLACVPCDDRASCTSNPSAPCMTGKNQFVNGTCTCVDDVPIDTACNGGTCLVGFCCTGCISGTLCLMGSQSACGSGGNPCSPCDANQTCCNGQCQPMGIMCVQ